MRSGAGIFDDGGNKDVSWIHRAAGNAHRATFQRIYAEHIFRTGDRGRSVLSKVHTCMSPVGDRTPARAAVSREFPFRPSSHGRRIRSVTVLRRIGPGRRWAGAGSAGAGGCLE